MGLCSMKKYEIYIIEILMFISIIMFNIIFEVKVLQDVFFVLLALYMIIRFGFMKDNNYLKRTVSKMVVSCILVYSITIYLLGLLLGFNKTPFSLSFDYFLKVLLLESVVIVAREIIRYIIARNTQHKRMPLVIYTILLIILSVIVEINGYNLRDNEQVFVFITTVVLPSISMQALCSYLTYKVSYVPALICVLFMSLYQYVLPIIPNLGNYLYSLMSTAFPYLIYYIVSKLISYKDKVEIYRDKIVRRLILIPILIVTIVLTMLVSGLFSHTMVAIGSNSMVPIYEKGDAVIYKKIDPRKLQAGEIIAFEKSNRIITHRIVKIIKTKDSFKITTKGDANNAPDVWTVSEEEVLGVVKYRIKYVGYPTLWFNDIYSREETE